MEHCARGGMEKQDVCAVVVDVAKAFGFDPELPAGSPGSMLVVDPKAAHLIGDYCNFVRGVICNGDELWMLSWDDMNLSGTIPASLNKLQSLRKVYAWQNKLTGSIPDLDMPNLQELRVGGNLLSGGFPALQVPKLWRLDVSDNQLTGQLPLGVGQSSPELRRFDVGGNLMHGRIPFDLPFFNNSNGGPQASSIGCGFSGNSWSCPIEDYVKSGPSYSCEWDKPIECMPDDLVV